MIDHGKKNVLGVNVDAVDYDAAVTKIIKMAQQQRAFSVTALAVHGVMTGVLDPVHRHRLNRFDLIVPDGQPVRWAINSVHKARLADRVYGPTLMLQVCEHAAANDLPIFLYGSKSTVLEALTSNLKRRFPRLQIAGTQPSRFRQISAEEKQATIAQIRQSGAAITFVGLGCPRQEVWTYEYVTALSMPTIAVGAAFDFHAGTLAQAPAQLQKWGLEWAFRLFHEPTRLWRRYLFLNPAYLGLLALQLSKLRSFDPAHTIPPTHELRYG